MSALPILVEWGNVISKLVVVGAAGLALLGFRALRNHRDVRPARADAHRMGLSIDEPREGAIAVRGTYHTANDERWLDCGGQHVLLAADVAILRGSAATWNRGTRTYSLEDGDHVIAIGTMARRAGAEATDYREAAGGWQLRPSAGESAIHLCIAKPVALPRPLWPIRGALVLAIVGLGAYVGLGYLGGKLVAHREYPREAFIEGDGVSTFAAEVASALPRHRDEALNRFAIDLEYKPQTEEVLAQRIELARLHDCRDAAALLYELKRFEEAIASAVDCDRPEYGRASLVALGRYDDAAQITTVIDGPFGDDPLVAMIGAGRWRDAAAFVETREHRDPDGDRCFVRYLKSLAGATDAGPPAASASPSKACRILDGTFDDEVRDEVIARWAFAGGPPNFIDFDRLANWLAPHVGGEANYNTHALRANLAIDLGRFDAAAAAIQKALAALGPIDGDPRLVVAMERQLTHTLALRTGKPIAPFEPHPDYIGPLEEAGLIRSGADPRELRKLGYSGDRVVSAITDAVAGDGLPLARAYEAVKDHMPLDTEYLLAIAPSVTAHREELLSALRHRRLSSRVTITLFVHELAIERDLARLLGDTAHAERLQAIIDRHAKAFGDPSRLKALFLAQLL